MAPRLPAGRDHSTFNSISWHLDQVKKGQAKKKDKLHAEKESKEQWENQQCYLTIYRGVIQWERKCFHSCKTLRKKKAQQKNSMWSPVYDKWCDEYSIALSLVLLATKVTLVRLLGDMSRWVWENPQELNQFYLNYHCLLYSFTLSYV